MTRSQRAQVVELLRVAADDDGGHPLGLIDAFRSVRCSREIEWLSWRAYDSVKTEAPGMYRGELLEAAARVELGEWP